MGIGAAILGAGAIAGVSGIAGSAMASDAQSSATDAATRTQRDIYNSNKAMLTPWNDAGFKAYGTLNDLLGVGGNSASMKAALEGLPGYQFTREQGLKSVQNSAAARGLGTTGSALKGAASFATGLADSTYGNQVNRLMGSANMGLSAANALAGVGTSAGQGIANSQIAGGNAAAAGWNGMANAFGNAAGYLPMASMMNNSATTGGWSPAAQQAWAAGV